MNTQLTESQINFLKELSMQAMGDKFNQEKFDKRVSEINALNDSEEFKTSFEKLKVMAEANKPNLTQIPLQAHTATIIKDLDTQLSQSTELEPLTSDALGWEEIQKIRFDNGLLPKTKGQYFELKRRLAHMGKTAEQISGIVATLKTYKEAHEFIESLPEVPKLADDDKVSKAYYGKVLNRLIDNGFSENDAKAKCKDLVVKTAKSILAEYPEKKEAPAS